jgi:hypothetical protein
MLPFGKNLVLYGQKGAAGINQIDLGEMVLKGDLLGTEMLLHCQRVVGAALDRGVVGDNDALNAADPADSGDDRGGRNVAAVHVVGGQLRQFKKRGSGVEQSRHLLARQ